jgi:methyl-accepting chemotaxis protein
MGQSESPAGTPITLEQLRRAANKFLLAATFGMTVLCSAVAAIGGQNIPVTFIISAAAALTAVAAIRLYKTDLAARLTMATVLAVQVMMLIFSASNLDGSHVQEAHMIYFVLNGYLLSYACCRSLLVYNIVVVAHHFVLTFLMPAWVWTADPATSGISHLAIHAGIATILVGPLMFVAVQLHNMIANTHRALTAADQATQSAHAKAEEAERNRLMTIEERRKAEAERATVAAHQATVVEGIAAGLSRLAGGNLVDRLVTPFAPEYETLRIDFNAAVAQLQAAMTQLRESASGIRTSTQEIAGTADDLARRAEQQAASVEQTTAALQVVSANMRKTSENAKSARDSVTIAKHDAERSAEVLRKTISAVSAIEASAKEIGNIISVIDEIAFQTNLLALNAGVEAARAGDAGRGFAVVATEVRALAQRSADAAKQIKTLISASSQQVENGVKLVGETGQVLANIAEQVNLLNGVIHEIATAAQEQTLGINQVTAAISRIEQGTQRDAAMVEETAAAATILSNETAELDQLAARFQVAPQPSPRPQQAARATGQRQPSEALA